MHHKQSLAAAIVVVGCALVVMVGLGLQTASSDSSVQARGNHVPTASLRAAGQTRANPKETDLGREHALIEAKYTASMTLVLRWYNTIIWNRTILRNRTARSTPPTEQTTTNRPHRRSVVGHGGSTSRPSTQSSVPSDLAGVKQCIKDHESGIYTRNNHGSSGASGAYQIVRSTWQHYASQVGVGASVAYQASPADQDKVVDFMLTHGGAHNWDPKFGNDPCTTRLP